MAVLAEREVFLLPVCYALLPDKKPESSRDFSLAARTIAALAFAPPAHLENAIAEIAVHLPQELMPVLRYFENNYIGKLLHVRPDGSIVRKEPRFPVSSWSVYQRTLDQEGRTNNYAEAAHRRLQTKFGVDHPSLWRFIEGLKKVQRHRDLLFSRFVAGDRPVAKRRKYTDTDRRILELLSRFNVMLHVEFLQGIACNIVMEV